MSWLKRLGVQPSPGSVAAVLGAALIAGFTVLELVRPRQQSGSQGRVPPSFEVINVPIPLRPGPATRLQGKVGGRTTLTTDKAQGMDTPLVGVTTQRTSVRIAPLTSTGRRGLEPPVTFRASRPPELVQLSTVQGRPRRQVAYAIRGEGDRIWIERHDLERARPVERALSASLEPAAGARRDLRMALWSGRAPDLFVIDRGLPGQRMRIRILSGESKFRATLLAVVVSQGGGFPARSWSLDVGRVAGGRPDILLVSTSPRTASGKVEAHVLSGDLNYSQFHMQVTSVLDGDGPPRRSVLGYRSGSPTWFSVSPRTGLVQPFVLHRVRPRRGPA